MLLFSEKTAQELFYEQFHLPAEAMQYNCDGYHNGCLLEFKKSNRTTINAALFHSPLTSFLRNLAVATSRTEKVSTFQPDGYLGSRRLK